MKDRGSARTGSVFAYDNHNGFPNDMFLRGRLLSDAERYCETCDGFDTLICEIKSVNQLIKIMHERGIEEGSGEFVQLVNDYIVYSDVKDNTSEERK